MSIEKVQDRLKELTTQQQQFCLDVHIAIETWTKFHPDFKYPEDVEKQQNQAINKYKTAVPGTPEAELELYRALNKILKAVSGLGISEPPGTGDPEADFQRAMKILG